ncbi:MAG: hypothetical protein RBS24_00020 [Bacilli bacterium]|nr:hypothetical protein [Bacilli bacterium]
MNINKKTDQLANEEIELLNSLVSVLINEMNYEEKKKKEKGKTK